MLTVGFTSVTVVIPPMQQNSCFGFCEVYKTARLFLSSRRDVYRTAIPPQIFLFQYASAKLCGLRMSVCPSIRAVFNVFLGPWVRRADGAPSLPFPSGGARNFFLGGYVPSPSPFPLPLPPFPSPFPLPFRPSLPPLPSLPSPPLRSRPPYWG